MVHLGSTNERGEGRQLVLTLECYYSYYMPHHELKVARIGNSRGVRLPAEILERYRIGDSVIMEERADGILLRPRGPATPKLSWEETARAMAAASEDWSQWDVTSADGLDAVPWSTGPARRVAEQSTEYGPRHGKPAAKLRKSKLR